MRMWAVNPAGMCDEHLLVEYEDLLRVTDRLSHGLPIVQCTQRGDMNLAWLHRRHRALTAEMYARGFTDVRTLPIGSWVFEVRERGWIDHDRNVTELCARCIGCAMRLTKIDKEGGCVTWTP